MVEDYFKKDWNEKMTKILQIACGFYPRIGGIEQVTKDISDVLKTNDKKTY